MIHFAKAKVRWALLVDSVNSRASLGCKGQALQLKGCLGNTILGNHWVIPSAQRSRALLNSAFWNICMDSGRGLRDSLQVKRSGTENKHWTSSEPISKEKPLNIKKPEQFSVSHQLQCFKELLGAVESKVNFLCQVLLEESLQEANGWPSQDELSDDSSLQD